MLSLRDEIARMEYDLVNLFDHLYCCLFEFIPSTIAVFGTDGSNRCAIQTWWRRTAGEPEAQVDVVLKWDLDILRIRMPEIDAQVRNRREWSDDRARQVEEAATVVAAAVLGNVEPDTFFTRRSDTGTGHDYYLNSAPDEMIEVAGLWDGGLSGLFEKKRKQSDQNPTLRKRWVSVTVVNKRQNRTEGLHSCPPQ
jgi:hypothetical protein